MHSTARRLTKVKPLAENKLGDTFEIVLFFPKGKERKGEGSIQTKGYFMHRYKTTMKLFNYFVYFVSHDGIALILRKSNLRSSLFGTGVREGDFYVMRPEFLDGISDVILRAGIIRQGYESTMANSLSQSSFFIKF